MEKEEIVKKVIDAIVGDFLVFPLTVERFDRIRTILTSTLGVYELTSEDLKQIVDRVTTQPFAPPLIDSEDSKYVFLNYSDEAEDVYTEIEKDGEAIVIKRKVILKGEGLIPSLLNTPASRKL